LGRRGRRRRLLHRLEPREALLVARHGVCDLRPKPVSLRPNSSARARSGWPPRAQLPAACQTPLYTSLAALLLRFFLSISLLFFLSLSLSLSLPAALLPLDVSAVLRRSMNETPPYGGSDVAFISGTS
jgi:hypothetical protein